MKRIVVLILITLLLCCNVTDGQAQNYGRRIGFNTSYLFVQPSVSLKKIDGTQSCCPLYTEGTGNGISLSALGEMQISGSLVLGLRAFGSSFSNSMVKQEETSVLNPTTNQSVRGVFEHRLEASFLTLGIEPVFSVRLLDFLTLHQSVGISAVTKHSYRQYEQIVEPSDYGTFIINGVDTKKRINNDSRGDITNANTLRMTVGVGLSTELALGKSNNLWLSPELWYEYGLTDVVPSATSEYWRVNMIRAGLSLKYGTPLISDIEAIIRRKILIDTVTIRRDGISTNRIQIGIPIVGADTLYSRDEEEIVITQYIQRIDTLLVPLPTVLTTAKLELSAGGKSEPLTQLSAEETIATTSYIPLLRYVFFDDGSATLPVRYSQLRSDATGEFRLSSDEVRSTMKCYYQLLNIIGGRMRKHTSTTITVTGCAPEEVSHSGNEVKPTLSLQRATTIRNYLHSIWGIDTSRILLRTTTLPDVASNPATPDGAAENRRIELSSNDTVLLAPVTITDTTLAVSTRSIRATIHTTPLTKSDNWQLRLIQGGRTIFTSETRPIDSTLTVNIESLYGLKERGGEISVIADVITATGYTIRDSKTLEIALSTKMDVTSQLPQRQRNKFNLILFPVRSAELGNDDAVLVAQLRKRIQSGTHVSITGHTDRTGDVTTNRALAAERARSVANALGSSTTAIINVEPNSTLYDNTTPEGRFYCRTVEVILDSGRK